MLHVYSNVDQVLRYSWNGKDKQCQWSLSATGRFDIGTLGQESAESAAIDRFLQAELERGTISAG
jgi:hypothetical protein